MTWQVNLRHLYLGLSAAIELSRRAYLGGHAQPAGSWCSSQPRSMAIVLPCRLPPSRKPTIANQCKRPRTASIASYTGRLVFSPRCEML